MSAQSLNLEAEIISAITGIPATMQPGRGDDEWTAAIKRSLITLGRARGYSICAAGFPDECEKEWLFDLVWYRNEPQEHLREIGLVLESELSKAPFEIKYDFEKLLVAKSPIKVMVFQDNNDNLPKLWSLLETGIRNFQPFQPLPTGERYILAAYENAKDAFSVRTIAA
jgi:hypothetical protein